MEIIISNVIVGCLIIIAYTLGLKNGKTNINTPVIPNIVKNPIKTIKKDIRDRKEELQREEELRKYNIIMNNIESYNGDELGQEEVK